MEGGSQLGSGGPGQDYMKGSGGGGYGGGGLKSLHQHQHQEAAKGGGGSAYGLPKANNSYDKPGGGSHYGHGHGHGHGGQATPPPQPQHAQPQLFQPHLAFNQSGFLTQPAAHMQYSQLLSPTHLLGHPNQPTGPIASHGSAPLAFLPPASPDGRH